jgi:deoxyribose-phosphate aldolase
MDQKWLREQTQELELALAEQGFRGSVPMVVDRQPPQVAEVPEGKLNLARFIDHTLLKPDASRLAVKQICEEAREYQFRSVCVNPVHIPYVAELLQGTAVRPCTVIGFPLGASTTLTKVMEARDAIANGAQELDMVLNVGALVEGDYAAVLSDIKAVRDAAPGVVLKVILETGLLTKEQIVRGSILVKMAGADFVKTSTGFGPGGATVEDIRIMRAVVGPDFGVKASGGVRDYETAVAMIRVGATRIGTSSGTAIIRGVEGAGEY